MQKERLSFYFLFLPGIIYFLLFFYWTTYKGYSHRTTGDEGHYMITAMSLWEDHDFDVKNNYERDFRTGEIYGPIDTHISERNGKFYSIHGIGLPILIAPFVYYWNFGLGGKIIILLIFSLMPFLLSSLTKDTANSFLGNIFSSSFCIGFPFLMASSQIYNELIVSVLIVYSVINFRNFRLNSNYRLNVFGESLAYLILLLLPWFRDKYLPIYFLISIIYLIYIFRTKKSFYLYVFLCMLILNCILFGWYTYIINGKIFGTNNNSIGILNPESNVKLFFAYIFDSQIGIVFNQPLSIIGIMLIVWFLKFDYKTALLSLTFFVLIYLPASLVDWAFGFKLNGLLMNRICWPIYPLFYLPIGYYMQNQQKPNYYLGFAAILFLGLQIGNIKGFIDYEPSKIIWDYTPIGVFSSLNPILPHFYENILTYQNVIFILLVISGILYTQYFILAKENEKKSIFNYIFKILLLVYSIGIVSFANVRLGILPNLFSYRGHFHACKHLHQVGKNSEDISAIGFVSKSANISDGEGLLLVSNYFTLPKGKYFANYHICYSNKIQDGKIAELFLSKDFGSGLANLDVIYDPKNEGKWHEMKIPFEIQNDLQPNIETLLRVYGKADFKCDYISIEEIK